MKYHLALIILSLPSLLTGIANAASINAEVSPPTSVTVPVMFSENITYDCSVTPGNQPEWLVDTFQLINPNDDIAEDFANTGIFIEILSPNTTRLIVTPGGRRARLGENSVDIIECQCTGFRDLNRGDVTRTVSITTYNHPDPPGNLDLVSMETTGLTLVWDRPENAPSQVETNYTLSIFNVTDSGNVRYLESTMNTTSFSIHFLEESLLGMPCQRFQFTVTAENDAGLGSPAIYNETVPISANTSEIDATLSLVFLNLGMGDDTSFTFQFRTVESCSDNFPVLDYTVNVNGNPGLILSASDVIPLTLVNVTLNSSFVPLFHNRFYLISVTVRSAVSERDSTSRRIQTTDVQSAEVIFHQTYVQLICTFADITRSLGCLFRFSPNLNGTGEQEFVVMREGGGVTVSQCNSTMNQRSAYIDGGISVFDIESSGSEGIFSIRPSDREVMGTTNFTMTTGCAVDIPMMPTPTTVVAIVIPVVISIVVILLAVVVVTVIIVVCYMKHRDNTRKLIHTERELENEKLNTASLTDGFEQKLEVEKKRKLSLQPEPNGVYRVNIDTGDLIDTKKCTVSPSSSAERNLSRPVTPTSPTTPLGDTAAGGPPPPFNIHLQPPGKEGTGSTGSYSPERPPRRPEVLRSFSEGSPSKTISRGAIQIRFQKGSLELQVNQESLLDQIRKSKAKKSLKSRSLSHDPSASREDTTPLLSSLSEVHFSDDLLDVISEESLEYIREESGNHAAFQVGGESPLLPGGRLEAQPESPVRTTTVKDTTGQEESTL